MSLRRLGLGPADAGRLARLCLERGAIDPDLLPLLAAQRAAWHASVPTSIESRASSWISS